MLKGVLILILGTVGIFCMLFVVVPYTMDSIQTDSGMCGRENSVGITQIYSLKSDASLQGKFVLGTGSVRSERMYFAYKGDNSNGYMLVEFPAFGSVIFEDSNETAYVETVRVLLCNTCGFNLITKYKIHVPKGTIKMEYAI